MNGVEVIGSEQVKTLRDFLAALSRLSVGGVSDDEVYINDGHAVVTLEEQVLTDGSKVYNLNIGTK